MDSKLQKQARDLLAQKQVDIIIGYEKGYDDFHTRPVFITNDNDVDRLIINEYCTNNLAVYLPMYKKLKVGIVAKGSDISSIRQLINEHQIQEENVVIIDVEEGTEAQRHKGTKDDTAIEWFEKLSTKEKGEFWNKEFERCIRCYACRQVCPVCYCPDCFVNRTMPKYLNKKVNGAENKLFQMIRMMHVFGRCTDCRACDNACPVRIPLHLLTKKIAKDALELFGYTSGQGKEHPFSTFKKDEILEGI